MKAERDACSCGGDKSKCDFYPTVREEEKKSLTNYDLVVRKTPEELAEFFGSDPLHNICPNNCQDDFDRPCKVCVLNWLKQEAN